jgi:SWI/SNF related-matrix-associated actin-dependent regulator of chromatin subfamily C
MPSSKESGKFDLHKAASTALGAAAIKAKVLADHEDREMQRLVNAVVELQLKKLELKMSQFEELEQIMEQEKREIERQRRQLYLDRIALQKNVQELNNGNIPSDGFNVALVDQREANMLVDQAIAKPNDVTML